VKRSGQLLLAVSVTILTLATPVLAQSGRKSEPPAPPPVQEERPTEPAVTADLEKVKLILSDGWENFVKDLNANGKLGYRLEKSVSYGGKAESRSFAAVLRLHAGDSYEYDWISNAGRRLLDSRLNYQAKKGFNFAAAFALTFCDEESEEADNDDNKTPLGLLLSNFLIQKGNAFLLERKNGSTAQSKEYKIVTGNAGPRGDAKKNIQAALDAAPQGFRPVKILTSKAGMVDFAVSVLLERDLPADETVKTEYRFVKEVTGFDKAVNKLAAQGFRFVAGGRIGLIKFAVLAKQADDASAYTFIKDHEHAKKFDKALAQGKSYHGLMEGEVRCDEPEVANQKLVFALRPGGEKHEYKILNIFDWRARNHTTDSLVEFRRLVGENYRVRDLFYSGGLNVILEK
jgi:hypothetical protein